MNDEIKNKFKLIFDNIHKYNDRKSIKFWTIGTDFFLYWREFTNLILTIVKDANYTTEKTKESYITLEWAKAYTNDKGTEYCNIIARMYDGNDILKYRQTFARNGEIYEEGDEDKALSKAAYRQFFESLISLGLIFSFDNSDFKIGAEFKVIHYLTGENLDKEYLKLLLDITNEYWEIPTLRSYSTRDIIFTILFTYYFYKSDETYKCDFKTLEEVMGNASLDFREKSKNISTRNFVTIVDTFSIKSNSFKALSTVNKWNENKENSEIFNELLDLVSQKIVNNWETNNSTIQNSILEIKSKQTGYRYGQIDYRDRMLNDLKRYAEENMNIEVHDVFEGVTMPSLVQAAHILDYRYCEGDQEYDAENGLLLDPSFHNYFDRDYIAIDNQGKIYVKDDKIEEVTKIIDFTSNQVKPSVLTDKMKVYLEMRLAKKQIDLSEYRELP